MKHWLLKMSFQKKMFYCFAMLFAVSLTAFFIFFSRSYKQERTTELAHMKQYNGQLGMNLDAVIANTDALHYLHFSDDKIRNLLKEDDSDIDAENQREMGEKLKERLALLTDMSDYVLRSTIVTEDGRIYKNLEEKNSDYIARMQEQTGDIKWKKEKVSYVTPVHREIINLMGYDVVTMVTPMWDVIGKTPIAMIYMDLDFRKISNLWYESAKIGQNFDFMVLSQEELLFDSCSAWPGDTEEIHRLGKEMQEVLDSKSQEAVLKIHGQKCVAAIAKNQITGWYLVQYVPQAYLTEKIFDNMSVLLLILAAVIIITIAGSYLLSRQVSRPVRELSEVMGNVANTTGEDREIAFFREDGEIREDEIGQMICSYNAMAKRINDNIIKDYIYKLNQKQTELKMLQFQINPHFLYNALNTISAIAKLQDVEYIPEISESLSNMFRYNISEKQIVTVAEELKQTENYMSIQKIRFPQRFQMDIHVDEELKKCEVLKFILQPIVENAYKYGFTKSRKKDLLCISGYREGTSDMVLVVEDNGVGIEPEKVKTLNEAFQKEESFGEAPGIGLRNVNARLKNYYGEEYGIRVESELGCFTKVYLKLKYVSRPEEN